MPVSAALHAALDLSHIVVEFDLDGHLIEVNSNFLTLMGVTREGAIGQPHAHFQPRTDEAEQGRQWLVELERTRKERETLAKAPMVYAGNFSQPGLTYRLHRGDPMQKREFVVPGTLAVFHPLTLATNMPEQERRLQLADWIANPENPLTARVLVHRDATGKVNVIRWVP